jgi:FkbM family methyltransferase
VNRETKHFFLKLPLYLIGQAQNHKVHCVQVGANDGEIADPLYPFFLENNWSGLLLEPNPLYFKRLEKLHQDRDAVTALNVGASDTEGEMVLHFLAEEHEMLYRKNARGCATFDRDRMLAALIKEHDNAAEHMASARVPLRPLRDILAEQGVTQTDVLIIDTEGHEPSVLAGIDMDVLKPKLAIVENNTPANKAAVLKPFKDRGYRCFSHMRELVAFSPDMPKMEMGEIFRAAGINRASS